jgi:hypothetical protein
VGRHKRHFIAVHEIFDKFPGKFSLAVTQFFESTDPALGLDRRRTGSHWLDAITCEISLEMLNATLWAAPTSRQLLDAAQHSGAEFPTNGMVRRLTQ